MKKTSTPLFIMLLLLTLGTFKAFAQQVLYTEEFNYAQDELPTGWVIDADQPPEWGVNISQIAGGEAPELYMGYGMQTGLSRLISSPIDIAGHEQLSLRYKQYLINFSADAGEEIGLDVTFDGGTTWQPLWEAPLGLMNIPQDEYVYYFNTPNGATEMQFAFRFEGNNFFINGWAIDDIVVETVIDNDLVARKITGNTTPNIGEEATYIVTVENGGALSQNDYTIKLFNENGNEVSSVQGVSIDFAETMDYTLTWTPSNSDLGAHIFIAKVESTNDQVLTNNETKDFRVNVQYEDTEAIQIGDVNGTRTTADAPYDFYNKHSLTQTLYKAEEITASIGTMNGLEYTAYFDNDTEDVSIQIYLGETSQSDMSTNWVDPTNFTLVYDGSIDFQKGLNNIYIPFDTAYNYTGDNLVVYSNKSYPEQVLWVGFINIPDDNTPYSRVVFNNDEPYDAMNPPNGFPRWAMPNISLFFSSGELAVDSNEVDMSVVSIYPNPVTDKVTIVKNNAISLDAVTIYDIKGKLLNTIDLKNMEKDKTIDISNLQAGIYILKIKTDNYSFIKRLIKE